MPVPVKVHLEGKLLRYADIPIDLPTQTHVWMFALRLCLLMELSCCPLKNVAPAGFSVMFLHTYDITSFNVEVH